jgi:release factor glutamine methyltransferase
MMVCVSDRNQPRVPEAVDRAAGVLAAAGVPSPRVDAELIAAHVLGVPRGWLVLAGELGPAQLARFERLVARRARRVPLQHLTGTTGFGKLELAVGPGGFVPRPETELLAQWAVTALTGGTGVVVDLGAGTGALALSVAHDRPRARVLAVEGSPAALAWLRRNAATRATAGDRPVEVVAADATDPAALAHLEGTVDLVVCNPPYVPDGVPVPPEVADHDPPEAVFGGPDGLAVIRPVIARAAVLLRPGGWLGIEHDESHGEAVPRLLRADGRFAGVADHRDLAGRPRYATARRVAD